MKTMLFALLIILSYAANEPHLQSTSSLTNGKTHMMLQIKTPDHFADSIVELRLYPSTMKSYLDKASTASATVKNGVATWILEDTVSQLIVSPLLGKANFIAFIIEPGDSTVIDLNIMNPEFTGKGSEKFKLVYRLKQMNDSFAKIDLVNKLSGPYSGLKSVEDYLKWNEYLNIKAKHFLQYLKRYKDQISDYSYKNIEENILTDVENKRIEKFSSLMRRKAEYGITNLFNLTNEDLCTIYDSTIDNEYSKRLRNSTTLPEPYYSWKLLELEAYRGIGRFFRTIESDTPILGKDPEDKYIAKYNLSKFKRTGKNKEQCMAYTFWFVKGVLAEVGFTPKIENILTDYYQQQGHEEYKQIVKTFELKYREKSKRQILSPFSLTDTQNHTVDNKSFKGKIVVFDLWFTGCTGCIQMAPAMRKVQEHFANDTNIVFVNVSTDKNVSHWKNSIIQKKYTTGLGKNVYTEGKGIAHSFILDNYISSYPSILFTDQKGRIIPADNKTIDPRRDNGQAMIAFLNKHLALGQDGPYLFYNDEEITIYKFNGDKMLTEKSSKNNLLAQYFVSDLNQRIPFSIKNNIINESCEYPRPDKLFVLSDIEGNFEALRKLLVANNIIDNEFNWVFGDGHLVFCGDMFDRGNQVTECLWLMYYLEEKAKIKGGYVHFILGNHEIMNLQGDNNYVVAKYQENAKMMQKNLRSIYAENSELGKWLRTKNIVERIGNILFMHGGISSDINRMDITLKEINDLARPEYSNSSNTYKDSRLNTIMSSQTGPFWFRGYYNQGHERTTSQQLDSTLAKFQVNHIITGHTIVADTICSRFNGRVINTDTKHAEGNSEALLIENDAFYRVNQTGKRQLLLISRRNPAPPLPKK